MKIETVVKFIAGFAAFCLVLSLSSCTVVEYRPLAALQLPASVQLIHQNLVGVQVSADCFKFEKGKEREENDELCDSIFELLEQQGAQVVYSGDDDDSSGSQAKKNLTNMPLYRLEIEERMIQEDRSMWWNVIYYMSYTLFPLEDEYIFAFHIKLYDQWDFVVYEDRLLSHVTEVHGIGYYLTNSLANAYFRTEQQKITDDISKVAISRSFYERLVQHLVNAKTGAYLKNGGYAQATATTQETDPKAKRAPTSSKPDSAPEGGSP